MARQRQLAGRGRDRSLRLESSLPRPRISTKLSSPSFTCPGTQVRPPLAVSFKVKSETAKRSLQFATIMSYLLCSLADIE